MGLVLVFLPVVVGKSMGFETFFVFTFWGIFVGGMKQSCKETHLVFCNMSDLLLQYQGYTVIRIEIRNPNPNAQNNNPQLKNTL